MDEQHDYPVLRKILTWAFYRFGRLFAKRFVLTVIYSALDWDIPPSEFENAIDEYLDGTAGGR